MDLLQIMVLVGMILINGYRINKAEKRIDELTRLIEDMEADE